MRPSRAAVGGAVGCAAMDTGKSNQSDSCRGFADSQRSAPIGAANASTRTRQRQMTILPTGDFLSRLHLLALALALLATPAHGQDRPPQPVAPQVEFPGDRNGAIMKPVIRTDPSAPAT